MNKLTTFQWLTGQVLTWSIVAAGFSSCLLNSQAGEKPDQTVSFKASDGLEVTADLYLEHKNKKTPMLILFHQAGFSRGEYRETAPQFNALGFNCMAVDARSGNQVNGVTNETAKRAKAAGKKNAYADAYPDLEGALTYIRKNYAEAPIVICGSSYSSSLVFRLAAEHPKNIKGLLSFSPAVRGWNQDWLIPSAKKLRCPAFITSAKSEQANWQAIAKVITVKGKITYTPESPGKHGSRALWKTTPGHEGYWKSVKQFLRPIAGSKQ